MFNLILLAIATWRLSSLIRDEDGPYDIFDRFRNYAGITEVWDIDGERELLSNGTLLADIIKCFWCLSVWVAGVTCLLAVVLRLITLQEFIFFTLATSAIAIYIEKKIFGG